MFQNIISQLTGHPWKLIFIGIFLLSLFGCATEQRAGRIRAQSHAAGVCTLHNIPLSKGTGYEPEPGLIIDFYEIVYEGHRRNPNAIPLGAAREKGKHFPIRTEFVYCSQCEAALGRFLDAHPSKK